jgi:cell division ATPase FtsA
MYATAIGLVIKGEEINNRNQSQLLTQETSKISDPTNTPIHEIDTEDSSLNPQNQNEQTNEKESYFDKWVNSFMKFLANDE